MRVYLPATTTILRELADTGQLRSGSTTAFAVTPGLLDWYAEGDQDELEYAAMLEAARASLRLLDADPAADRRRVVVVAELSEDDLVVRDDLDRGVVQLHRMPLLAELASVHVDDDDARAAIGAAAAAILRADLGDQPAQDAVDDAEGFELSWYATQEISALLEASALAE